MQMFASFSVAELEVPLAFLFGFARAKCTQKDHFFDMEEGLNSSD